MTWQDQLRATLDRGDIGPFLADLQALVAALRNGEPWDDLLTAPLRAHPDLVLGYLSPGPKRDAVAAALT